jgi:hypothetical protein
MSLSSFSFLSSSFGRCAITQTRCWSVTSMASTAWPVPTRFCSQAWGVLAARVKPGVTLSSPQDVKDYLRLQIGMLEHEVFCVVFLDAQHRVIELQQMFRGTVTQTSVYPREVVKEPATERCGCHPGAQPSVGFDGAQPCRRNADADAQDRAAAGGRAGARSPGGHRERSW